MTDLSVPRCYAHAWCSPGQGIGTYKHYEPIVRGHMVKDKLGDVKGFHDWGVHAAWS